MWFSILTLNLVLVICTTLMITKSFESKSKLDYANHIERREANFCGIEGLKNYYYYNPDYIDNKINANNGNIENFSIGRFQFTSYPAVVQFIIYKEKTLYVKTSFKATKGQFAKIIIENRKIYVLERGMYTGVLQF